eukprot:gnl/TRDRNA2_/TRDRNA2_203598_c0_seq1.p1 gnl/TRDRNA2_/TRDRNA2_203598_c0~~gnl/TRDRNA2_/TRDRNA2_203598_c0_seq1.p1  ORF type:complete len:510 (+),score=61.98 gnl/TRDRNA2_/TRDRNA2_203598_c0_seq1:139-1530(+)
MCNLLGNVPARLQLLDQNPEPLERWLRTHRQATSKLVGHYYEVLLHFAFSQLAPELCQVVLASEPVPKDFDEKADIEQEPSAPLTMKFNPPIRSNCGREFICWVLRASRDGDELTLEYRTSRGDSAEPIPNASGAVLLGTGADGSRQPKSITAEEQSSELQSRVVSGSVVFSGLEGEVDDELRFVYGPGFSEVKLPPIPQSRPKPAVLQGEVDFVIKRPAIASQSLSCPPTSPFVHLEVAVKFFLASRLGARTWDDFIAPNPIDILGKKLRRMLHHQLHMGKTPHIQGLVAASDASKSADMAAAQAMKSYLWMNGRLFFHVAAPLDGPRQGPEDWHARVRILSPDLEVGWWCRFAELAEVLPRDLLYVTLVKPYWLAPLRGHGRRDKDHGRLLTYDELLDKAASWRRFQFVAVLSWDAGLSRYEELCRGFVVPNYWPMLRDPQGGGKGPARKVSRSGSEGSSR